MKGESKLFKSIFVKYITSFALLIGVGFTIITLIMSAMITNYSIETKESLMYQTAEITYTNVNGLMQDFGISYRETLERYSNFLSKSLDKLSDLSDSIILLTSEDGQILFKLGDDKEEVLSDHIPESVMEDLTAKYSSYKYSTLSGLFDKRFLNYIYLITDTSGESAKTVGAIFICSSSTSVTGIVDQMTKTIIISSIWVFLAALIAVYFISERIIEPLKEMSRAAKSFSKGHFDVRVPVVGTDEVANLATAFNNMADELEKIETNRRTFLANVSHDLRTPMTSISGFIDGIIDGTIPPEKQQYYLQIVSSEVRRLSRLVNSLLDITRMEAGEKKFNKVPFDVCELARLILISFEEKIESKHLSVEFSCSDEKSMVFADRDAIHQVIFNLCDNAIKFVNDGGTLKISVTKKEKKYHVSVYNTGQGISPESLSHVFDRFYKTDSSRGLDKGGAGLGLYICKSLIDSHEEEITVKSMYGIYCEFIFTLPSATSAQIAAYQAEKPKPGV